jgi:hypothetical protein
VRLVGVTAALRVVDTELRRMLFRRERWRHANYRDRRHHGADNELPHTAPRPWVGSLLDSPRREPSRLSQLASISPIFPVPRSERTEETIAVAARGDPDADDDEAAQAG